MTTNTYSNGDEANPLDEPITEAAESTEPCEVVDDCLLVGVCDGCTYDEDDDYCYDDYYGYYDECYYYKHIYEDEGEDEDEDEETLAELDEQLGNAEDRLADVVSVDARTFRHYREAIRKASRITDPAARRRLEIDATLTLLHAAEYGTDLY